jgi:acetyltransferase-like isoleucine patch superfamily enzyme
MPRKIANDWFDGVIPDNVILGHYSHIETSQCFELLRSTRKRAVILGDFASVYPPTMFDIGPRGRVRVGDFAMLNGPRIVCEEAIDIGACSLIAWNVVLMDCYRAPKDWKKKPIKIEDNVWIGFDSIILPGVTIGRGAVVGARSVVKEDVPPYSIVAGNPARVVGHCGQR